MRQQFRQEHRASEHELLQRIISPWPAIPSGWSSVMREQQDVSLPGRDMSGTSCGDRYGDGCGALCGRERGSGRSESDMGRGHGIGGVNDACCEGSASAIVVTGFF